MLLRTGYVWQPIGKPSGFAPAFFAAAASTPAAEIPIAVVFMKSLREYVPMSLSFALLFHASNRSAATNRILLRQSLQIRHAGLHRIQIHFDEKVLDAALFRRSKNRFPIERVIRSANGDLLLVRRVPALAVQRDKASGIFVEIGDRIKSEHDLRNLVLEFHEVGIEKGNGCVVNFCRS